MSERQPSGTVNLDIYGHPPLEWRRARDLLAASTNRVDIPFFLGTAGPDGRPHSAGIGALWNEGDFFIVSGPHTRKSRDLATNPSCTISARLEGMDLVFDGEAARVVDKPTLERAAALFREGGWPAEVDGDSFTAPYSAPSAGPPPWYLYRFVVRTAVGVASAEPHGATRWTFG